MPTKSHVRVVLVGDRPVVLCGLSCILDMDPALRVVGEARSSIDALKKVSEERADVVIACVPLGTGGGAALVKRMRGAHPSVAIVAYALQEEARLSEEIIGAGALSCLSPSADRRSVIDAVRLAAGKQRPGRRPDGAASTIPPNTPLSRRELQVLTLIAEGNTNKQIAEQLGISVRTVETHRERVMRKLNAQGTAALTKWAISLGLVTHG